MNSCILMAEIVQEPQLRYTSDNQTPIAEMLVQIPGLRDDDPLAMLKVVAWGKLAQEVQTQFHEGDRVIVEGRLSMLNTDRPEGFKEKQAELTAQRIHRIAADATLTTAGDQEPDKQMTTKFTAQVATVSPPTSKPAPTAPVESVDYADVPF